MQTYRELTVGYHELTVGYCELTVGQNLPSAHSWFKVQTSPLLTHLSGRCALALAIRRQSQWLHRLLFCVVRLQLLAFLLRSLHTCLVDG